MIKQYLQIAPTLLMIATLAGGVTAFVHAVTAERASSEHSTAAGAAAPPSMDRGPVR